MAVETFGSGIPATPRNQLKAREKLFAQEGKTIQQIQTINSNVAWVKLRSSANTTSDKSPELAQNFILISGTQTSGLGARSGVNTTVTFDNTKAYNSTTRLGTRPMPGITSFKVASKGTYGTLQQAEIGFKLWTKRDLDACEQLYFRPGFSVIVEYGHSAYTTDGENIRTASSTSTVSDKFYFANKSFSAIEKEIFKIRNTRNGNYDGFLGLIQNFSWSLTSDGGYDCSIKVVSKGVVLESLSLGKPSDFFKEVKIGNKEETRKTRQSIFHTILLGLAENTSDTNFEGKAHLKTLEYKPVGEIDKLKPFQVMRYDAVPGDTVIERILSFLGEGFSNTYYYYVPLQVLLDIMNNFVLIKAGKPDGNGGITPASSEEIIKFDINSEEKFKTFGNHYSVDPLVALPPSPASSAPYNERAMNKKGENQHTAYAQAVGSKSRILNIPVNVGVILSEVESLISSENEDGVGALDIIKSILAKITRALGNINDFDITTIQDDQGVEMYTIVDRDNLTTAEPPIIGLTGLKSTLANVDLSSKISSNIASQIAIAAQADDGDYQNSIGSILDWNKGVIDRHAEAKSNSEKNDNVIEEAKSTFTEDIAYAWERLRKVGTLDKADFDNVFQEATVELQKLSDNIQVTKISEGVVPVELSLKMLGISGLKIGTTFRIRDSLLPKKYEKFSYIITGLDHEIGSDNKWYTNIRTQFYLVQKT